MKIMGTINQINEKSETLWEFVRLYRFVLVLIIVLGIMGFAVPLALLITVKILTYMEMIVFDR